MTEMVLERDVAVVRQNAFWKRQIIDCFCQSAVQRDEYRDPYVHSFLRQVFPDAVLSALQGVTFPLVDYKGQTGSRELHNNTRNYFNETNNLKFASFGAVSAAFQDIGLVRFLEKTFDVCLHNTSLRIEYTQDTDAFYLEPHTDVADKLFTLLVYISDDPRHQTLGTDIYASRDKHVGVAPFAANHAMLFVPTDHTWHGFEKRRIQGVRKSVIINYVTSRWRARDQLAFPHDAILTR